MRLPLICLAQSRDNRGGDVFVLEGEVVPADDEGRCRAVVNRISEVTGAARAESFGTHVEAHVLPGRLVLDVSVIEHDAAGRNAAIAVLVDVPEISDDAFLAKLEADLVEFAQLAGRTLAPGAMPGVRDAVEAARKKKRGRRRPTASQARDWLLPALLLLAIFFALCAGLWIASKDGWRPADTLLRPHP